MRALVVKLVKKCCLVVVVFTTYSILFHMVLPSPKTIKYILVWNRNAPEFDFLKNESILNGCKFNNCIISQNKGLFYGDTTEFDAILFSGKALSYGKTEAGPFRPRERSIKQIFVFVNRESSSIYPLCDSSYDGYFNLTWTYRLDSDIPWPYFKVYDREHNLIGPRIDMVWEELGGSIEEGVFGDIMDLKELPAVWISSRCHNMTPAEEELLKALAERGLNSTSLKRCGIRYCTFKSERNCTNHVSQYYFYFAFERSQAEDFVTDNFLKAYKHNVIPVVYGGADYNRFLPPNSYIDARKLGRNGTAEIMLELLGNHHLYMEYFLWQKHYYFSQTDRSVCKLCELVNKKEHKVYRQFRIWWNPLASLSLKSIC